MRKLAFLLILFTVSACMERNHSDLATQKDLNLIGTWELISSKKIQNDEVEVDDLSGKRMIKVINDSHFAFMNHDLKNEADTLGFFVSGAGKYSLEGNQYTEYLEYCNYREWEGHVFEFSVKINGDTLVQQGLEEIEELNVSRTIIETYLRTNE